MNLSVIRNPETGELELQTSNVSELLKDPLTCAEELKNARQEYNVLNSEYKQKVSEAAKLDLVIQYLENNLKEMLILGEPISTHEIFASVHEYNDYEIVDENKIPEDYIVKRQVVQINRPLIKEYLRNSDHSIPGVRKCKKLRVIVK